MNIEHNKTGKSTIELRLDGRLDTTNAPLLERKIKQWGEDITELILDFSALTYISSMGLRVLLQAKKELKQQGRKLTIKNMNDSVREVFEMTGFLSLMVQEEKFVVIRKNEPDAIVLSLNGELRSENVEMLSKELAEIREANITRYKPVTVILDMEKLTLVSPAADKLLKKAVEDTKWEHRKLQVRNAPDENIRAELETYH